MKNIIKWAGTAIGLVGIGILALAVLSIMWVGFLFYLISNVVWAYVAWKAKDKALLTINIGFGLANIVAVINWLWRY